MDAFINVPATDTRTRCQITNMILAFHIHYKVTTHYTEGVLVLLLTHKIKMYILLLLLLLSSQIIMRPGVMINLTYIRAAICNAPCIPKAHIYRTKIFQISQSIVIITKTNTLLNVTHIVKQLANTPFTMQMIRHRKITVISTNVVLIITVIVPTKIKLHGKWLVHSLMHETTVVQLLEVVWWCLLTIKLHKGSSERLKCKNCKIVLTFCDLCCMMRCVIEYKQSSFAHRLRCNWSCLAAIMHKSCVNKTRKTAHKTIIWSVTKMQIHNTQITIPWPQCQV